MFLKSLSLRQFRNLARLDISLSSRLNLFVGPNGSGKSNLLEAVSVLCTSQSHRGADPKHLIQWGRDSLLVKGEFRGEDEDLTLEIRQKPGRPRQIFLNGQTQRRLRDWMGRVPLISFSPEDLSLVKGEPAFRRRALNAILCQVDVHYLEALQRYNKVLAERNAALRQVQEGERDRTALEPWTLSLLKDGVFLTLARRDFIAGFQDRLKQRQRSLSAHREEIGMAYKPSFLLPNGGEAEAVTAANRRRLQELTEAEIAVGSTLIGPHRDDVDFSVDGNPAKDYASQGQQRTLALAMKLAEHDFLSEKLGREPLCLFDDVLSELDPARRENLVELLSNGSQCLVTLTSLADWPDASKALHRDDCQVFQVAGGGIVQKEKV